METEERKPRDDVTRAPWTVSVAPMPGESPCPELDKLDLALRKTRDDVPDPNLEEWKRRIIWPEPTEYGEPVFLSPLRDMPYDLLLWMQMLELQRDPIARLCWNVFKYTEDALDGMEKEDDGEARG